MRFPVKDRWRCSLSERIETADTRVIDALCDSLGPLDTRDVQSKLTNMLTVSDEDALDRAFGALANRRRRHIVRTLALQPASIAQLAREQDVSLPAIHRHIIALEEAGLIERKKSGRENFLALRRVGVLIAQQWLGEFHAYWGESRESLENYVAAIERERNTNETAQSRKE